MLLTALLAEYKTYQAALAKLSPAAQHTYWAHAKRFCAWLGDNAHLPDLTPQTVKRFALHIAQTRPRSAAMYKSALNHWENWLIAEGWINGPFIKDFPLPKVDKQPRQPMSDDMICELLAACDRLSVNDVQRANARALVSLLSFSGLRRGEILRLTVQDIDLNTKGVRVHKTKNGHPHLIYLPQECIRDLRAWYKVRPTDMGHDNVLINRVRKPMQPDTIIHILKMVQRVAGLENERIFPHRFRHSAATRMVNNGAPLTAVAALLNHSSINITAHYVHDSARIQQQNSHLLGLKPTKPEPQPEKPAKPAKRWAIERRDGRK